ncbi:hypothetical protein, partial [Prosthecobacter sp.]|uniref:hypothetical protein n=1 Tax=Prosthecobacter sp. TaxID=1965333 RepID=UPI0025FFD038
GGILAFMLALPVGAEACSVPGSVDVADQPHALIGTDDHATATASQAVDVTTDFVGSPALSSMLIALPCRPCGMLCAWTHRRPGQPDGLRVHRRLCVELC